MIKNNYIKCVISICLLIFFPKEGFVSGIVTEKYIFKSVCVFVKVGLRVQRGDPDMIERARESNKSRIQAGQGSAKATAVKTYEILKSLIKKHKLKSNFGEMPEDYDDFPRDSDGYSKFREKIIENNADDFTGKECIYSFPLENNLSDTEILLYFNKLPKKDIRDIIVRAIKIKIIKDEGVERAERDIKNGLMKILIVGEEWHGEPQVDSETGLPLVNEEGDNITNDYLEYKAAYNETMRNHFRKLKNKK